MLRLVVNVAISVAVILVAAWLARRYPSTAGFVTALPITTMLVLVLSHADGASPGDRAKFAKSLLLGIPLTSTFLVPFVFAPRMNFGFWTSFGLGISLLAGGYAVHRTVVGSD
jgi:hypothetical protein